MLPPTPSPPSYQGFRQCVVTFNLRWCGMVLWGRTNNTTTPIEAAADATAPIAVLATTASIAAAATTASIAAAATTAPGAAAATTASIAVLQQQHQ